MNNSYRGETVVKIFGRDYPMIFNMNVIAEFEANAGKDFNHLAISSFNALKRSEDLEAIQDRAEILTGVISRVDAAWLFYLGAKEADSHVTFEEIQEAVQFEGFVPRVDESDGQEYAGYPLLFVTAALFATVGIMDEIKKKKLSESQKASS